MTQNILGNFELRAFLFLFSNTSLYTKRIDSRGMEGVSMVSALAVNFKSAEKQ